MSAPRDIPLPVPKRLFEEDASTSQASSMDDDFALAKALQEQERAFYLLQGDGVYENAAPGYAAHGSGSEGEAEGVEEAEDDEALARRLQAEEQAELYQRMLEMAGYGEGNLEGDVADEVDPDNLSYEELQALGDAVGTVSRGVPASVICQLPEMDYSHACRASAPTSTSDMCCICRMDFEDGERVKRLGCSHLYHSDCITQWLGINKVCPVCNTEVGPGAAAAKGAAAGAAAGAAGAGAAAGLQGTRPLPAAPRSAGKSAAAAGAAAGTDAGADVGVPDL